MRTRSIAGFFALGMALAIGCSGSSNKSSSSPNQTLQLSPATSMIGVNATVHLDAQWVDSTGTATPVPSTTTVTWTSSDTTVATVTASPTGGADVQGVKPGSATITATADGKMATATVTVTSATLTSIEVSPANPQLAVGTSQQLVATGVYSDNTMADLTAQVTWASSSASVATVGSSTGSQGLVDAVAAGSTNITATLGSVSGSTTVTVSAATLVSIAVTPTNPSIANGTTQQLTAMGTFSDASTQDLTTQVTWASSDTTVADIGSSTGVATGKGAGTSTLTATLGSVSGSTTLTVTAATLVSIAVTPTTPSIAVNTTQQFAATGTFSDATTQDLTTQVTWASSDTTVADVGSGTGLATSKAAGTSNITATLGSVSGSTTLTVTAATLVSIAVTPVNPSIAKSATQQFTAIGTYSDASTQDLTAQVTWASATASVASISNAVGTEGVATGNSPGSAVISATLGSVSGSTTLTVTAATLVSIAVTPVNPSIAKSATQQFTATGTYSDSTTADLTAQVSWASATPTVAMISNAAGTEGLATGVGTGTSNITATLGTVSGSTTLTVTAATLVSIAVTPTNPSIAKGTTQQFTATGTYSDATTADLTSQVTWASATASVATISNATGTAGLATGLATGTSNITATLGAVSGSTTLTVSAATLVSIAVTPTNPSIAKGTTQQLTATGTYSDASTQNLTTQVTWTSSASAVATVSNATGSNGLATGLTAGTSTLTATLGGISGSTSLTVTAATLVSIAVMPTNPSIAKGTTFQFAATGTYSDSSTQNLTTQVTWTSSAPAVASISNAAGSNGLATGLTAGTSNITATLGGVNGSTTLTVTAATLVSIAVTPANPSIAKGTTQQFTATGTYSDSSTQNLTTQVTWASATTSVASISNVFGSNGLATGLAAGTSNITATLGAITGSTTLTVTNATLVSIAVTPANPSIAKNTTLQFVATGTYSDASTQDLTTQVTWASSNLAIASISNVTANKGLATGLAAGTSTIKATLGAVNGSTTLTVTNATLVSIAVTPADPSIVKGTKQQFVATGTYSDSSTQNLTNQVFWMSSSPTIATISNVVGSKGLATGVAAGTSTIKATFGAVSGMTTLTVTP